MIASNQRVSVSKHDISLPVDIQISTDRNNITNNLLKYSIPI